MTQIAKFWDEAIVPALVEYIRIPAKSPHFDKDWAKHGHIDAAVKLAADWCRKHALPGMKLEVVRIEGRTPVLLLEIEGKAKGNVLIYGHLDKQPEMTGWREGFGPWTPVIEGGKLYGRGGDAETGIVKPSAFHAQIPDERSAQAKRAAEVLGEEIWRKFPFVKAMRAVSIDLADLVLNRTWRPALSVTGAEGLPAPANAGNV